MKDMFKTAALLMVVLMLLCGFIYPLAVTGVSQVVFNKQANGSLVEVDGQNVGSELLGQNFTDSKYFKGRISAVNYNTYSEEDTVEKEDGTKNYNGVSSGSENLAASNPKLEDRVKGTIEEFLKNNQNIAKEDIPMDLVTSSGSGLDPNISKEAAMVQVKAISKNTGISENRLKGLIDNNTNGKQLGVLGEERVNVLMLNLDVYKLLNVR